MVPTPSGAHGYPQSISTGLRESLVLYSFAPDSKAASSVIGLNAEPGFLFPWVAKLYCSSSKGRPDAITSIAPVLLLINVMTPVGFGSGSSSSVSTISEGTHLFNTSFAWFCNSRLTVISIVKPPPPVQEVSSEGHPNKAFFLSSFVDPKTANCGSFNNLLLTSAETCSALFESVFGSAIVSGANFADLCWISTMKPSLSMTSKTSFLLSKTLSGYFRGL